MRLLNVHLRNLNSLVGDWTIDFEDPAYRQDGLFAITGPTGAGKSTILDAICLALFGKTPRQDKINGSVNELMSRQTGDCKAEVTFETAQGVYRSSFAQKRAHNKPDGNLQNVIWELSDAVTGKILADGPNGMKDKVPEILGMDCSQFNRAVVLAQGQFREFLESSANDRAKLLEKITGTEIYTTISQKVYQKTAEEKRKNEELSLKLGEIQILDSDALSALELEKADCIKALETIRPELDVVGILIQKVEQRDKLNQEWSDLETQTQQNALAIEAFAPQREQLRADEKAQPLVADYQLLEQARKDLTATIQKKEAAQTRKESLRKRILEQRIALDSLQTLNSAAQLEYDKQIPTIRKVQALDEQIQAAREQSMRLPTKPAELKAFAKLWERKSPEELNQCDETLQNQIQADEQGERDILGNLTYEQYDELIQTFDKIRNTWRDLRGCQSRIFDILQEKAAIEDKIKKSIDLQSRKQKDLEIIQREEKQEDEKIELLTKLVDQAVRIQALEQHRNELEAGAPCPLCGSVDHPYCTNPVPEASKEKRELADAKKRLRSVQTQIRAEAAALEGAQKSVELYVNQLSTQKKELERLESQRKTFCAPIHADVDISVPEIDWRMELVRQKIERTQLRSRNARACQTRAFQARDFRRILDGLKLKAQRADLFGTKDPVAEERNLNQNKQTAADQLAQCERQLASLDTDLINAEQSFDQLQEDLTNREENLKRQDVQFADKRAAAGFENQTAFEQARLTESSRQTLRRTEDQLKNQQVRLAGLQESLEVRRAQLAEEAPPIDQTIDELRIQMATLKSQSEELLQKQGQLNQQLRQNKSNIERFAKEQENQKQQESEFRRWSALNDLIGSAAGDKFNKIVQRMSFEILLDYANEQLTQLSKRFILTLPTAASGRETSSKADDNLMSLYCIDRYQADEERPVSNLSGGESFLVSLALALGLSRMNGANVSIDSLFLDEGFGTLDEQTLQTALEALVAFQTSGTGQKIIGIISHVEPLKERIANKIEVEPASAGTSRLKGPGVRNG